MKSISLLILLGVCGTVTAQNPEARTLMTTRLAAARYIQGLYDPATGGFRPAPDGKPGLRATSAALRATRHLGGKLTDAEKTSRFVMSCFDEKSGGFAEPGEKANAFTTSVGIMAAVELNLPREKFKKSMEFLKTSVLDFEDVRIAAAGIEAFGIKVSALSIEEIFQLAEFELSRVNSGKDDPARLVGSCAAMILRLGGKLPPGAWAEIMQKHQRADGGWGKLGVKESDLETTYRVMRSLWLMKEQPKNPDGLRKFLEQCRREDGGFGVDAKAPSSAAGTYYFSVISEWLDAK